MLENHRAQFLLMPSQVTNGSKFPLLLRSKGYLSQAYIIMIKAHIFDFNKFSMVMVAIFLSTPFIGVSTYVALILENCSGLKTPVVLVCRLSFTE